MSEKKKNYGKEFEKDLKDSIPADVYYYRLRDATGSWGMNQKCNKCGTPIEQKQRFQAKNDYDFFMFRDGVLFTIDAKSYGGKSLPFTALIDTKKGKTHQADGLKKSADKGAVSGIIVNFRDAEETYFMHIYTFLELYSTLMREGRKSIPISLFREYGVHIGHEKKVSRYRYNIDGFILYHT